MPRGRSVRLNAAARGWARCAQAGDGRRAAGGVCREIHQGDARSSIDDPAKFPKKAELLDQLARVRAATVAVVKSMTDADLAVPMQGPMAEFFPTHGHVVANLIPSHLVMHVGQIQVIRRKLGKPHLM